MEKWVITGLYTLAFGLPTLGIGRALWRIYADRRALLRNEEKREAIEHKYQVRIDEVTTRPTYPDQRQDEVALINARTEEWINEGVDYLSYDRFEELVDQLRKGNLGEKLTIAKADLGFVGGGILAGTAASIWTVWI